MLGNAGVQTLVSMGGQVGLVDVEASVQRGLPGFFLVGLAEKAVKESRDRVRSALINSGFKFPMQRVLVNLSPGDLPKSSSYFDLAIALAVLLASKQLKCSQVSMPYLLAGELGLKGDIRPVAQALSLVLGAKTLGRPLLIAKSTQLPDICCQPEDVLGFVCLKDLCEYLSQATPRVDAFKISSVKQDLPKGKGKRDQDEPSLDDVKGLVDEKIGLMVALIGRHHCLLSGPPGVGKSLLVELMKTWMPDLSSAHMLEVALINSWVGQTVYTTRPPFRKPHHHITRAALMGGGLPLQPGEISLAHRGLLFLDELTEYPRSLLDLLRQPLESGSIDLSRAHEKSRLSADFQLVAAMNPCPCGYWGDSDRCHCGYQSVIRYQKRLSGPLLDRIDLKLNFSSQFKQSFHSKDADQPKISQEFHRWYQTSLVALWSGFNSNESIKQFVTRIQQRQYQRQGCLNRSLSWSVLKSLVSKHCQQSDQLGLLQSLSVRSQKKILGLAMSVADATESPLSDHALTLALSWRFSQHQRHEGESGPGF